MTSQVTTTPGSSRRSATLLPSKTSSMLVGADALSTAFNLRHLGKGPRRARWSVRHAPDRSWPDRRWDHLRLVGLKLIFLIVSRAVSLLGLSRREAWWKDAEILMLRHQLAVAGRERPGARARLT